MRKSWSIGMLAAVTLILTVSLALRIVGAHQSRKSGSLTGDIYEIVFPLRVENSSINRNKHGIESFSYSFNGFGRHFVLDLKPVDDLLHPKFHVMTLSEGSNNSSLRVNRSHHLRGCLYEGKVRGDEESTVSLSSCRGLFGLLHTCHGDYRIEPDPEGDDSQAHRLYSVKKDLGKCHQRNVSMQDESSSPDRKSSQSANGTSLHSRSKRSVSKEWNLEMLVVADSKMKRYHGDNLEMYILTLMASVALIYKDPSIGNNINISVVKLIVMKEGQDTGIIFPSASKTLRNFCRWQQQHNDPSNQHGTHHDTAILLTREDLCRLTKTCDTLGLAQSGMVCDRHSSCAVVEDNGLSAAFTIAHELGHVLGIPHDDDKKCARFQEQGQRLHVMARMLDYNSHPWSWSDCSRHYITTFLDAGYGYCLLNKSHEDKLAVFEHASTPAGELYDMDYQCELVFGQGSKICPYMPVCKRLWCTMEDVTQSGCRTQHMPWADGTKCGPHKSCHHGECVREPISFLPPQDGKWGDWQGFGPCSRSCGGGIRRSQRECDSPRPTNGGRYCVGDRVRYESCQTQDCPPGSKDFREEQCSAFNGKTFGFPGIHHSVKWVPHYAGIPSKDVCKLYCRAAGTAAYFLLKEKVIDGTSCGPDTFDICINGICMPAGCDHKLNSKEIPDACGVCGGNGTTCKIIHGDYVKVQYGYNHVVMVPAGASNIEILQFGHENTKDDNYLALMDYNNTYILNGDYMISMFPKTLHYADTILEYSGSDTVVERINATKQLQKNLYVQVLTVGSLHPPSVSFNYTISLQDQIFYHWRLEDSWSPCNSVCQGEQYMKAVCVSKLDDRLVSDGHCHEQERPSHSARVCNTGCFLRWHASQIAQCSSVCGKGNILNDVKCVQHVESGDILEIPDQFCAHLEPQPNKTEDCIGPCNSTTWKFGEWSECSTTCGGGFQFRTALCVGNAVVELPDSACNNISKITTQSCALEDCPQWEIGDWNACSTTCGQGEMKRLVQCRSTSGAITSSDLCNKFRKPEDMKLCEQPSCPIRNQHYPLLLDRRVHENMVPPLLIPLEDDVPSLPILPSPPIWKAGVWSQCSMSCGEGKMQRRVTCHSSLNDRILSDRKCNKNERPADVDICHLPCGQWMSGEWSECPVTCGEGIQIRHVVCLLHDGKGTVERMCDLQSRPPKEQLCQVVQCNDLLPEAYPIPPVVHNSVESAYYWRTGLWSKCSKPCGGGLRRRQVACYDESGQHSSNCDVKGKPLDSLPCNVDKCPEWNVGSWSKCSVTCGAGIQTRQVLCFNHKGVTVPHARCNAALPEREKKCKTINCLHWSWSPWSQCSSSCGRGTQRRTPRCHRGRRIERTEMCDPHLKPQPQHKQCKGVSCTFTWRKKKWSKCSTSCGRGHKHREVFCANGNNITVADDLCKPHNRPQVRRRCDEHLCPLTWTASHWSECSQTCGRGFQTRTVTCHRVNAYEWIDPEPQPPPESESTSLWCNIDEKPSESRGCSVGNCNASIWRPEPWLPCSVGCGPGRQKRKVHCYNSEGKRLKNDKCERRLRPQRRRKCNMRPCSAVSCLDYQQRANITQDGEQEIFVRGRYIKIYCSGMNSNNPKEYITLVRGESDNYSEIYNKRLINPGDCPYRGIRYDSCDCVSDESAGSGVTTFNRIAINISSLQVFTNDFTYSQTQNGQPVAYGESGDCYSMVSCPQGRFSLSLLGTGFVVSPVTKWVPQGNYPSSKIRWLEQGQVIQGKCGGYCGKCGPDSKLGLLLEVAPP